MCFVLLWSVFCFWCVGCPHIGSEGATVTLFLRMMGTSGGCLYVGNGMMLDHLLPFEVTDDVKLIKKSSRETRFEADVPVISATDINVSYVQHWSTFSQSGPCRHLRTTRHCSNIRNKPSPLLGVGNVLIVSFPIIFMCPTSNLIAIHKPCLIHNISTSEWALCDKMGSISNE